APVPEFVGGDAVLGGQQHGAGLIQDEVQRGGPGGGQGAEPVDGPVLVQDREPRGGGAGGAEGELGDLAGGQDAVLVQHAQQPAVAGGQPGGERGGRRRGAAGGAAGGAGGLADEACPARHRGRERAGAQGEGGLLGAAGY